MNWLAVAVAPVLKVARAVWPGPAARRDEHHCDQNQAVEPGHERFFPA
ncbi:MAG TPA: hypothetical protein VER55_10120 [Ardenticatenaceae bacterium]|nr:hypothetical protein [Ardenticatenaceae bacterium]